MLKSTSTRMRLPALALVACALVATSCASATPAPPGATVPTAVVPVPSTSPSPYAVPPVITKAYVQSVLNALEAVNQQVAGLIVANDAVVPAVLARLRAIMAPSELEGQLVNFRHELATGITNYYYSHPGPIVDTVERIVSATPTCIFVAVRRNVSAMAKGSPPVVALYMALSSSQGEPSQINPTPWQIDFIGRNTDGSQPSDPCPAQHT